MSYIYSQNLRLEDAGFIQLYTPIDFIIHLGFNRIFNYVISLQYAAYYVISLQYIPSTILGLKHLLTIVEDCVRLTYSLCLVLLEAQIRNTYTKVVNSIKLGMTRLPSRQQCVAYLNI